MGSTCSRRTSRGTLADLGIPSEYEWDGLDDEAIDAYEGLKAQLLDDVEARVQEKRKDAELLQLVPAEAREHLKGLLMKRAVGLIHVLKPFEEGRKGMRFLHSSGAMSSQQWAAYQQAEELCAQEGMAVTQEAAILVPEAPPGALLQMALRIYRQQGGKAASGATAAQAMLTVHPDAKELPTSRLRLVLGRDSGEDLGMQLLQEPPEEAQRPGQPSCLVVAGFIPGGFAERYNASQTDPSQRLVPGDRVLAVDDANEPEREGEDPRMTANASSMLKLIEKDRRGITPLRLSLIRPLGPPLRFRAGSRVQAKGEEGWLAGTILHCWHEDSSGQKRPYIVRLDGGSILAVPRDHEDYVLAAAPGSATPSAPSTEPKKKQKPSDGWAKGMFGKPRKKSPVRKIEKVQETVPAAPPPVAQMSVHPDAREVPVERLRFVLQRGKGESLGVVLHHDPPPEQRASGQPSCLVVGGLVKGGFMQKYNSKSEDPLQKLLPGDRIMAVLDGSVPEDQRRAIGDDSAAMEALITKGKDSITPLVLFAVRPLGPPLRFRVGQQVKAKCGDEGWLQGTVVKCWAVDTDGRRKPYVIRMNKQERVVFAPSDSENCVLKGDPRFAVGQFVMVNRGKGYVRAKVIESGDLPNGVYKVKIKSSGEECCVPADVDQFVRALARFQKGDRVLARVDSEYLPGVVEEVYHPTWVYSIRLKKEGRVVTAPEDEDYLVKKHSLKG